MHLVRIKMLTTIRNLLRELYYNMAKNNIEIINCCKKKEYEFFSDQVHLLSF